MFRLSRLFCPLRPRFLSVAAVAFLGIVLALACVALAQDATSDSDQAYRQLPIDQAVAREARTQLTSMLTGGLKPGDAAKFEEFYQKAIFPAWTDPDEWSEGSNPRQLILRNLRQARSGAAYDRLNNLAMQQMVEFAEGPYHPVVRYNAMLLIGELNESEADVLVQPPRPAKPLPRAFPVLLNSYENEKTPDAVRLAALLGIFRHYELGSLNAERRQKVNEILLALAAMREAPNGRSKEGHAWFRRLAIEMLGQIGTPGEQGVVAKTIVAVLAESDAPLSVRAEAAQTLGLMKLTADTGVETALAAKSLGQMAIDVCQAEIALCDKNPERIVNTRRVKGGLIPIRIALTGTDRKTDRPPYQGLLGLMADSPESQTALSIHREVERLLDRRVLDRSELAPQSDKGKKDADPRTILGMDPTMGQPGGMGIAGPMATPVDPAKAASDEVIEELKKAVAEFNRILTQA